MARWVQLLLIAGLAVLTGLLSWWAGFLSERPDAAQAVPSDAIAVYKGIHVSETYQRFLKAKTTKIFQPVKAFQEFNNDFRLIDSFLKQDSVFWNPTRTNPYFVSLHKTGLQELGWLFCWQTQQSDPLPFIQKKLHDLYPDLEVNHRQFRNQTVRDYTYQDSNTFSMSAVKGIILISPHAVLVEDAIRQMRRPETSRLSKGLKAENTLDRLFVDFDNWPGLLGNYLNYQSTNQLKAKATLPGYASYDVHFKSNGIQLSGAFHYKDSTARTVAQSLPSSAHHFARIAPMQTAFLMAFTLPQKSKGKIAKLLPDSASKSWLDSLEKRYEIAIEQDLIPALGQQITLGINEPISPEFREHTYTIFHYQDTARGFRALSKLAGTKQNRSGIGNTMQLMQYRDYKMKALTVGPLFSRILGAPFQYLDNPYYTTIENFAVLAENPATLKRIIDDYEAGQTLRKAPHYESLRDQLLPRSQLFAYIHPGRARQLPLNFLSADFRKAYKDGYKYYSQFNGLVFQLQRNDNANYSQLTLQEGINAGTSTEKLWEKSLDTTLQQPPEIILDPKTNNPGLMLTDKHDQLYRLSNDGAIHWKKPLLTSKMGSIDTIDFYQNGKQQYFFATRGNLHLLNDKGSEVGSFPLSLSAPAVTQARTFRYEGNGRYRYFIGCQNNKIYGYKTEGSPLPGWRPLKLNAPLAFPLKYFRYGGMLRIFGVTTDGTLRLWNTQGILMEQYQFETAFTHNFSMHFGATDSTTYLVSTDTTGKAHFLYLNGDTLTRSFDHFGANHHFLLADLNGDGAESLIFAEGRKMRGYLPDGVPQFTLTLRDSVAFKPEIYRLQGRSYIGYVSAEDNRIFMIDNEGQPYNGFPLKGNTPFKVADMNRDGAKELVVGDKDSKVIMYEIE